MGILFGIDDCCDISAIDDFSADLENDFTTSFWVKYTRDGALVRLIGSVNDGITTLFQILLDFDDSGHNAGFLSFSVRDQDGGSATNIASSSSVLTENQWTSLIFVRSSNTLKGYVDNVEVLSGDISAIDNMSATFQYPLKLGCFNNRGSQIGHLDGQLTEFAIWTAAVTADERANLASSRVKYMPRQVQPTNQKAYWPMDDGPDGTSADGDTLRDLSGNGNDGTGDDGANNTGLTWKAEEVLSYPVSVFPIIFTPAVAVPLFLVMKLAFSVKQPEVDFETKGAGITFTTKKPNITFTVVDC